MAERTDVRSAVVAGVSCARDPVVAAREFRDAIWHPGLEAVLFFCSPHYDLAILGEELRRSFGDLPVVGCTTAGEITPAGYIDGSITGIGFGSPDFTTVVIEIDDLQGLSLARVHARVQEGLSRLKERDPSPAHGTVFAFLMIDGMSRQEETVVSAIFNALGEVPVLGGSAGDGLSFKRTYTYVDGSFRSQGAVLLLVRTRHPFRLFKTEHFRSTGHKLVVTEADSDRRLVRELNAEPAALEYARVIGLRPEELNPLVFAAHPLVVRVGGEDHVRSIQQVNPDLSLSFLCAIDDGIVLTVAESGDIVEDLRSVLGRIHSDLGDLQVIIGCDCILRRLEIERKQVKPAISEILLRNKVIGFSTYGEQYNAMHVNQTFTGVAIGYAGPP